MILAWSLSNALQCENYNVLSVFANSYSKRHTLLVEETVLEEDEDGCPELLDEDGCTEDEEVLLEVLDEDGCREDEVLYVVAMS